MEHLHRALAAGTRLGLDPQSRAEVLDDLSTELGLVDRWEEAEHWRAEAVDLWQALGDPLREGNSLRMRARALSRLARAAEARQAVDRALELLEPLGPTPALARTVEYLAAVLWHDGSNTEAIAVCDRAAALAEQLDLPDVLSDVLNTRACSMMSLDQDWVPTMQRALAVGLDAGCDEQVGRAYMNYYGGLVEAGRVDDGEQVFTDGMAFCEEREVVTARHFLLSNRVVALEESGRWPEAVTAGRAHLDDPTVSPVRRLGALLSLARIGVRRGDDDAPALLEEGLARRRGHPRAAVARAVPAASTSSGTGWVATASGLGQPPRTPRRRCPGAARHPPRRRHRRVGPPPRPTGPRPVSGVGAVGGRAAR